MNARFGTYHVLNWQKAELGGMSDALLATVQAVAKCNCRASPYLVANELIAVQSGDTSGCPFRRAVWRITMASRTS